MAYMSAEHAARIRNDLKAAFPPADGWKIHCAKSSGSLGINVAIAAAPVDFVAYDFDPYARDDDTPRTSGEARHRNRTKVQVSGMVNHYHFRDHYTPETVAILEKLIGIVLKEHWDESDSQVDYFHCAFYPDFSLGRGDSPIRRTEPAEAA